jgi:hypothetical protein
MNTDTVPTTTSSRLTQWLIVIRKWSKRWLPTFSLLLIGAGYGSDLLKRPEKSERSESGAVSLEQVLWFVAAGLSVAVVAGILWSQIRTQASTPINVPSAP